MAKDKSSFLMYCNWQETFESLTDEEAGQLIKHFFKYVNDKQPNSDNRLINLVFEPMKAVLKADLKKYEVKKEKNKENIRKRWNKENTNEYERINSNTNDTVNVNDKDNGNVNDKDNVSTKVDERDNIHAHEKVFISTSEIKSFMMSKIDWVNSFCYNLKINENELEEKISEFVNFLSNGNVTQKESTDLFIHFRDWYGSRKKNIQNSGCDYKPNGKLTPIGSANNKKDFSVT